MAEVPVETPTPSASVQPRILLVDDVAVSWDPTRGWLCEVDLVQPCDHTVGLVPAKHPLWRQ